MARFASLFLTASALALSGTIASAQNAPESSAPPIGAAPALGTAVTPAAPVTLRGALEAARARNLYKARDIQLRLTDPVAQRIVDWALVDIFGAQLGEGDLHRLSASLLEWPRADARRQAMEARLPKGPIPYTALGSSPASGGGGGFSQRRQRMNEALRSGDAVGAYNAMAAHGMTPGGVDYAEAESFAGWLALNKLKNPTMALQHFTRLDAAVKSPVSKARAAYWQGLAAEAMGDKARAKAFFEAGAVHNTTFYGQLAAERAGHKEIVLSPDPVPTAAERAAFEANEQVRALALLSGAGERELVRVFALHLGERVKNAAELAMLVDKLKGLNEQEVSLLAYRRGAQKGFILHERGYPVLTPPSGSGVEPAFVLSIVRQESQFDPRVRSHADARGMMQILPGTGRDVARRLGVSWSESMLWDPQDNMRLGSAYLGQLTSRFSGSYILATAGYNAGPGRPAQWVQFCGDPRASGTDPLDFMECIPFNETRNYVSNVMSNLQVYRARLNGGRAPLTLSKDLRRGSWGSSSPYIAGSGSTTFGTP